MLDSSICCTYLPSDDEGTNNLTLAIRNLQGLNQQIMHTNVVAQNSTGFALPWLDNIVDFFNNHSILGWFLGLFSPFLIIILVAGLLICCCLPIIRAFIIKSVTSSYTLINNPQTTNFYAPPAPIDNTPAAETNSNHSIDSDTSSEIDPYPNRYPNHINRLDTLDEFW